MPKSKTPLKAAPPDVKPTRKELEQLLPGAASLVDDANAEIKRYSTHTHDLQMQAEFWRQQYEEAEREVETVGRLARATIDELSKTIRVLERKLAESEQHVHRLNLYLHTTTVALQSAQHDAGLDAYRPVAAAAAVAG